ncbi:MAG TPA: Gfo/Idh/MocA family oxidoreductase, partial [Mycobacteriales bacterium]|nr:Gfo/Idh/MocA family oxidoreductase [Mycobacteriales bacterium]
HLVDQARYLFGPVARVYAEVDMGRSGAVTDDDCFLALEHVNGTRSHLWCSIVAPSGGPRIRLEGTRAGYVKDTLDGQEQALRAGRALPVAEPAGLIRDHVGVRAAPSVPGDWRAFYVGLVSAVRGRGGVPVEPADAVAGLRIIEAARRSAQLREVVML